MSRPVEIKDPIRKQRAEAVKVVCDEEWSARPGGKLEKTGRDGLKLVVAKAPESIRDADGEIVGVDAWVQLFDDGGRELKIDPHRRIINPPTVPRSGVRWIGESENAIRELMPDPLAAFWEAVWDSVERVPNPPGWRTRGTVTTVFSGVADNYITSSNATYTTARTGSNLQVLADTSTTLLLGQVHPTDYFLREAFVSFDTSAITDTDVVSVVTLDLWLVTDSSVTDFTMEVRDFDWGASVTTADWVAGESLSSSTLVASLSTSGIGATGAYKTFTSEAAFLTVANIKTGTVRLIVHPDQLRLGNAPTTNDQMTFSAADEAGTTQDPKLTITHQALSAIPPFYSRPNRIWRIG